MATIDLSKSQKKIARQVIEKGLQKEYIDGILELDNIISRWKVRTLSNRDTWAELYDKLKQHNKHIAHRYDYMSGSKYLSIIGGQLIDGAIEEDDMADFSEEVREEILHIYRNLLD